MLDLFKRIFGNNVPLAIRVRSKGFVEINDNDSFFGENKFYKNQDFSNKLFSDFTAVNCKFEDCDFRNVKFRQACFGAGKVDSLYQNCKFDGSDITATAPGNVRFIECSFRDINIYTFIGRNVEVIDCYFSGIIRKAFFNGEVNPHSGIALLRTRNEFRGNDFSNCKLVDFAFRTGIDLSRQVLPKGWENPIEPEITS